MDDPFGLLIIVLIAGSFLWRVVSGMLRGGGPSRPSAPSGDDQYAELRRRVERRRLEMEDARERMDAGRPAPGESYADRRHRADEPQAYVEDVWPETDVEWDAPDPAPQPPAVLEADDIGPRQPAGPPKTAAKPRQPAAHRGPASRLLVSRRNIRQAMVAREILSPPKGLRDPEDDGP